MPSPEELFESIQSSPEGLSIAAILDRHPGLTRRTAQRWLNELVAEGRIKALGAGRARRYVVAAAASVPTAAIAHGFPGYILLSADSRDVLAYVDQPLTARTPVGYQRDFLESYQGEPDLVSARTAHGGNCAGWVIPARRDCRPALMAAPS